MLSPVAGSEIVDWSVSERVVRNFYQWNGRYTYFVYLTFSVDSSPYVFHIDIEVLYLHETTSHRLVNIPVNKANMIPTILKDPKL